MANGPKESRLDAPAPPSNEEADRLAEQFRPSWEVEDAPPEAEVQQSRATSGTQPHLKQTLIGIQPLDLSKRTLMGIGLNESLTVLESRSAPTPQVRQEVAAPPPSPELLFVPPPEPPISAAQPAAAKPISSRPPTRVPAEVFDGEAAEVAAPAPRVPVIEEPEPATTVPDPPSGVAKLYHPKDDPNVPAVVVAPAALAASEAAANSNPRNARLLRTQTIPGTLRAQFRDVPAEDISFAPPRKPRRLWLGVGLGLTVGTLAALGVLIWGSPEYASTPPVLSTPEPAGETGQALPTQAHVPALQLSTPSAPEEAHSPAPPPLTSTRAPSVPGPKPPSLSGTANRTSQKTTLAPPPRKVVPPKKVGGSAPVAGTPTKSRAVIVRESPF